MTRLAGFSSVLVVDDEEVVRRVTYRFLSSEGYRVFEAADAGETLSVLGTARRPIDLVILDVKMPVVNGVELATIIRGEWPEQRLMFMSAYPAHLLVTLGGTDLLSYTFLAKPFTRDELLERVRQGLRQPVLPPPRRSTPQPSSAPEGRSPA